jgi:hypothetical protein
MIKREVRTAKIELALLAGFAIWLALGTSANAVTCPAALPNFSTFVNANGFQQQDCEGVPIQNSVLGPSLEGSADATGIARLDSLGAVAHANFILPQLTGNLSAAFADVIWHDTFRFLHTGFGRATLAFTVNLTGAITTSGNPLGGALGGDVLARLFVTDGFSGDTVSDSLTGPGVIVLQVSGVPLGIPDDIDVLSELRLEAFASGPGNATADFLDTFAITKIQLFDSTGTLLDDNVTLTDASGGALPVSLSPQPPAVPEPSSALLLAAGLGILASALRRPRFEGGAYRRL